MERFHTAGPINESSENFNPGFFIENILAMPSERIGSYHKYGDTCKIQIDPAAGYV